MKFLIIGDVHHTTHWKQMVENNIDSVDRVVFLGDYFDSWTSDDDWKNGNPGLNFQEIMELSASNEKVVTCIGNHDLAYLTKMYDCSGCQKHRKSLITELVQKYKDNLVPLHYEEGIIFSHAGVGDKWLENNGLHSPEDAVTIFKEGNYGAFLYDPIDFSGNGTHTSQTCLWIRPAALLQTEWPKDVTLQVCGHTELYVCPAFLEHQGKRLVIVDSELHDTSYVLDTENLPTFKAAFIGDE